LNALRVALALLEPVPGKENEPIKEKSHED
jgi:hypothetical protein